MHILSAIRHGFSLLLFRSSSLTALRDDNRVNQTWMSFLLVYAVLSGLLYGFLIRPYLQFLATLGFPLSDSFLHARWLPVLGVVGGILGALILPLLLGIYHFSARLLGGKATYKQFLAVYLSGTFALSVCTLPIFVLFFLTFQTPFFSFGVQPLWFAVSVYSIVFQVWLLRDLHSLSTGRAIGALFLPILFFGGVAILIAIALVVLSLQA